MADPHLHGNHDPCPACAMRRDAMDTAAIIRDAIPCNLCAGTGHLPLDPAEIIRRTVAEARRSYWPSQDKRG